MPILPLWMPSTPTMQRLLLARLIPLGSTPGTRPHCCTPIFKAYALFLYPNCFNTAEILSPVAKSWATVESAQTQMAQLPETLAALQKENEMLKQCLLEMSETVYA